MQYRDNGPDATDNANPLKVLTAEQFAALGGSAVAFLREIKGRDLTPLLNEDAMLDDEVDYHLLMSADGTPLLVTDTAEAAHEWLADREVGLVTLH